jgi:lysine biosynthesis protein LysW
MEAECPECYALIIMENVEQHEMVTCYACGQDLELVGDTLQIETDI